MWQVAGGIASPALTCICPAQGNMRLDAPRYLAPAPVRDPRAGVGGVALTARPTPHGLSFVVRAAGMEGTARRVADLRHARPRTSASSSSRSRERATAGARLRAVASPRRAALLVPRAAPRRASTSRGSSRWRGTSSGSGLTIVTPDVSELSRFEIAPTITDAIEQAGAMAVRRSRRSRRIIRSA